MSCFNFSYHKCIFCGNLTDDGCWTSDRFWLCLDCLDFLDDCPF